MQARCTALRAHGRLASGGVPTIDGCFGPAIAAGHPGFVGRGRLSLWGGVSRKMGDSGVAYT